MKYSSLNREETKYRDKEEDYLSGSMPSLGNNSIDMHIII